MTEPHTSPAPGVRDDRTPLHVAIDHLTVALLEVQQLRRQLAESDSIAAEYDRLEATLQELGELLVSLREAPD